MGQAKQKARRNPQQVSNDLGIVITVAKEVCNYMK